MKEEMKVVFQGMFDAIESSRNQRAKDVLGVAFNRIIEDKRMKNPEKFNILIAYDAENIIESLASELSRDIGKGASFYYTHYDFVEHHIEKLCTRKEGSSCSTDKARFIINLYLNYLKTDDIPTWEVKKGEYWKPKFGKIEDWLTLCKNLMSLYYGNPEDYFETYANLISAPVKTFDYLRHDWYIEMKDGAIIEIGHSWDEDKENPKAYLFNEVFAILPMKWFKDKAFEEYQPQADDCFLEKQAFVPLEEISRVYFETVEVNH